MVIANSHSKKWIVREKRVRGGGGSSTLALLLFRNGCWTMCGDLSGHGAYRLRAAVPEARRVAFGGRQAMMMWDSVERLSLGR